jgi:hypothetical protein
MIVRPLLIIWIFFLNLTAIAGRYAEQGYYFFNNCLSPSANGNPAYKQEREITCYMPE